MSGQTLTDRIAAAQYQLTGSDVARAVCKATTHEVMAPKKKHLECKCVCVCLVCSGGRGSVGVYVSFMRVRVNVATAVTPKMLVLRKARI